MRKILIALTVLSLCLALPVTLQNDRFSRQNRQVEITVDHHEIREIIMQTGVDEAVYLRRLQELGVTSIALREDELEWLEKEAATLVSLNSRELSWRLQLFAGEGGAAVPELEAALAKLAPDHTCYLIFDENLATRLRENIELKLGREVEVLRAGDNYILPLNFQLDKSFRAGIDPRAVRLYREHGFSLVARPDNSFLVTQEAVETVLQRFLNMDGVSTVVFDGPAVTGFPCYLKQTEAALKKSGLPVGIIKYITPQSGMKQLQAGLDYPSVLVHSNYSKVSPVLIAGSVLEDNIRLLYVHFDLGADNLAGETERILVPVTESLRQRGYSFAAAAPFSYAAISPFLLFVIALGGVMAPGLLLLARVFPVSDRVLLGLLLLGILCLAGSLLLIHPQTVARLSSLAAAILFPALAVISQQLNPDAPLWRQHTSGIETGTAPLLRTTCTVGGTFLRTTGISITGGLITAALASQPYFLSGTAQYMGVKLAYIIPLCLIFVQALTVIVLSKRHWQLVPLLRLARRFWTERLQVRHLIFLAVAAVMLYFYITRSGHSDNMTIWAGEVKLRYFFMDTLLVRPRFKELLAGHPLAIVALSLIVCHASRYRLLTFFALLAGAMGQISIVNSFSHWTTPVSVSLLRTANGLWIGLAFGILAVLLLLAWLNYTGDRRQETGNRR